MPDTRFNAYPIAVNGTKNLNAGTTSQPSVDTRGFLAATAGTLRLSQGTDGSGADIIASTPVTAGQYVSIPATFAIPCAVVLGGGASGTLFAI